MTATNAATVSVVTPSFNQGAYIADTIESVLDQEGVRVEYLVVDGGSTDATLEVLRRYGDRVRWISEPDRGQTEAINKGWRRTTGEVIAWLNTDDVYLPGALRRVVEVFASRPDVDAIYGDCDYVDAQGRVLGPYPTRPYDYVALVRDARNFIPQPAAFLRRRLLDRVGPLDETLHYVMDFDYWLRAGLHHTIAYLPVRLAATRLHARAKSVTSGAAFGQELVGVYRRLFARDDLPPHLRAVRHQAMGNVYYLAATRSFWEGAPRDARQYVAAAWPYASGSRRRSLALLWGLGTLGRAGVVGARVVRSALSRAP
ncbi:MAG: glycosyltransferase family 2 protein [Armatimonadota bacterium]|nr:glycosyltransferase family 2 protein [Armatimonadota bacterium]